MSITQAQLDHLTEYIGRGDVYLIPRASCPADGALMTHINGVPTGGVWVGLTGSAAQFKYKPEVKAMSIEQVLGDVAPRLHKEQGTVQFECSEATYLNIASALASAQTGTVAGTPGSIPTRNWIKVGGKTTVTPVTLAIVSPIPGSTAPARFEWICCYVVVAANGVELNYAKSENRQVKVTLELYADATRTEGDQLFQLIQEEAA